MGKLYTCFHVWSSILPDNLVPIRLTLVPKQAGSTVSDIISSFLHKKNTRSLSNPQVKVAAAAPVVGRRGSAPKKSLQATRHFFIDNIAIGQGAAYISKLPIIAIITTYYYCYISVNPDSDLILL